MNMLAYSAISGTIFTSSVGVHNSMNQARFSTGISDTMSSASRSSTRSCVTIMSASCTTATPTRKGCDSIVSITPLRKILISEHVDDELEHGVRKIKRIMASNLHKPAHVEELIMIDAIQRLGLDFYFQDDIHATLHKHYYELNSSIDGLLCLHDVALRFRLLRQQGYYVPQDTLNKFKNKDGEFKEEIRNDIKGLMSLHEASQVKFPREPILDDASEFSESILKSSKNVEDSKATNIIANTLANPCYKTWSKLTSNNFLQNFEVSLKILHDFSGDYEWTRELQNLARIDDCLAKINHQNEITRVTRWWNEVGLSEDLKLARNQPEKWHTWSLVCLPGLNMAEERVEFTKAISFVFIIDDIFDMYGTLEELILFTDAVNNWEYENIKDLPDYMSTCLKKLYEVTDEMSDKTYEKYGWNPKAYLQTMWADLCNAFLVEAKWFSDRHTPSTDEYLKNGRISSGVGVVCAYLFLLLGEGRNNTRIDLLNILPSIIDLGGTILRLSDDLGSGKDENENGNDGSYVTCYMNEHKDRSTESAREHVHKTISDAWKCINESLLSSRFSPHFKAAFLNSARMIPLMYCNEKSKTP